MQTAESPHFLPGAFSFSLFSASPITYAYARYPLRNILLLRLYAKPKSFRAQYSYHRWRPVYEFQTAGVVRVLLISHRSSFQNHTHCFDGSGMTKHLRAHHSSGYLTLRDPIGDTQSADNRTMHTL